MGKLINMIDNQQDSPNQMPAPDIESAAATPVDSSIQKNEGTGELDFSKLTHQNWLFINSFLSIGNIQKAYQVAKYEGRDASAPYQIFKKLKPFIEQIGDLDVTSRARLQANVKSMLELPLDPNKTFLTFSEMLRLNKFVASLTPEATQQKPHISLLVINRSPSIQDKKGTPQFGTNAQSDPINKDVVIDAEIVE